MVSGTVSSDQIFEFGFAKMADPALVTIIGVEN
jgi:hypothetical protein